MLIRKVFKSKCMPEKEMPEQVTSTPNESGEMADILDVSIIEPTCVSPILVSHESLEDIDDKLHKQLTDTPPGTSVVKRQGHCVLPCDLRFRRKSKQKSTVDELKSEIQNSAPDEFDYQTDAKELQLRAAESCEGTAKIGKSCSPFKRNFSLQTYQTLSKKTSPFEKERCEKITSPSSCTDFTAPPNLNSSGVENTNAAKSIPSFSYPGSPRRVGTRVASKTRSRSKSPSASVKDEVLKNQQRMAATLLEIMNKMVSTVSGVQPKPPEVSCNEPLQSRSLKKPIQRSVHFTEDPLNAEASPTSVVEELYFNNDMRSSVINVQKGRSPPLLGRPRPGVERPFGLRQSRLPCPIPRSLGLSSPTDTSQPTSSPCTVPCLCKRPPRSPASCEPCQLSKVPCPLKTRLPQPFCPPKPRSPQPSCPPKPCSPQLSCPPKPCPPQPCECRPKAACLSRTDSMTGGSDAKQLLELQNKLAATLQCLQNKEETIRVQAESLTCAEQRIALLTIRVAEKRLELEKCKRQLCSSRKEKTSTTDEQCSQTHSSFESCCKTNACCGVPSDPCCRVDQCCQSETEVRNQKNVIVTLQNNLSLIEELYRECFYEAAKQEDLIEKLRKSYLDLRLMEKEKSDRIGHLENVINNQKWSLETCQDIAMEVENLKMEISNFLNNSNNDSGMWEQSLAGEVGEDINDIMLQLHQLKELLQCESSDTGTLQKENETLRQLKCHLERQIEDMCNQKCQLEGTIRERDDTITCIRKENDELCCSMRNVRAELDVAKKRMCELQNEIDCVRKQLSQAQEEVEETKTEICCYKRENCELKEKNESLEKQIETADAIIKENCKVRSEVAYLTQQVALWRKQLAESEERVRCVEAELARARSHCRNVDQCYREKVEAVAALEVQLQEAHSRGAQLCGESRCVVSTVRGWIKRMQATNREQCQKIKAQESMIATLQKELQNRIQQQISSSHQPGHDCEISEPCPDIHTDKLDLHTGLKECFSNYRAAIADQNPFRTVTTSTSRLVDDSEVLQVGCSKCAPKKRTDLAPAPSEIPEAQVGCSKCAPKKRTVPAPAPSEIPEVQVGCSKCAPKKRTNPVPASGEIPEVPIGWSKCALKRVTDSARSTHDDSNVVQIGNFTCASERATDPTHPTDDGDLVKVGCSKCAPKMKSGHPSDAKDLKSEITVEFQVGCLKCTPKKRIKRSDIKEELQAKACGCEREDGATQMPISHFESNSETSSCSQIPVLSRKMLKKKWYNDRVTHLLRCTAPESRDSGVQQPERAHSATCPPARDHPSTSPSRIPRAVSPTEELLDRVSRLNDVMEESQRRWSRSSCKLRQPQRKHR